MGATQSIHNDTCEPVAVYFDLVSIGPKNDNYLAHHVLDPDWATHPEKVSLGLLHQACVEYDPALSCGQEWNDDSTTITKVCKEVMSPVRNNRHVTYEVSDILGSGTIPPYSEGEPVAAEPVVQPLPEPAPAPAASAEAPAPAPVAVNAANEVPPTPVTYRGSKELKPWWQPWFALDAVDQPDVSTGTTSLGAGLLLASVAFAVVGIKKLRSSQRKEDAPQEALMHE
eukprot:gnl/TRDRNA2_/TRDRNA2_194338_c0_seq1.p1 gnl/TRDRNA2_/TRDRNA2_194338_c0~~gnl/TRDRNA2_/TRDRNA2_194338_c0_seq1.p1  ORF type:complete len:254 (+),score=30.19 gnl/TRDRNA2_/TRDRNA2_194338_c0_seq1:83-763(+)